MNLTRRGLFKLGLLGLGSFLLSPIQKIFGKIKKYPDLVAIKDGSPAQMFEAGILALGGIEKFVKKDQTVLVKPNIGWNRTPSEGANTKPDLVGKIVELSYKAGAKQVVVFDNTCNKMESCYKNSGIQKAVENNKGKMLPSDDEKYYVSKKVNGKILKNAKIHKAFIDSDVIINVPVLKHHSSTNMTSALKNWMGVIWDRRIWHNDGLHQAIADFSTVRAADLTVIDAYSVMIKNGPRGISTNDLSLKKMQIISTDPVLADTASAKILNTPIKDIKYLKMAENFKVGSTNLKKANIKRIYLKGK